jgi:hypothetical protein
MSELAKLPTPGSGEEPGANMHGGLFGLKAPDGMNGVAAGLVALVVGGGLSGTLGSSDKGTQPLAWDTLKSQTGLVRLDPVVAADRDPFRVGALQKAAGKPTQEEPALVTPPLQLASNSSLLLGRTPEVPTPPVLDKIVLPPSPKTATSGFVLEQPAIPAKPAQTPGVELGAVARSTPTTGADSAESVIIAPPAPAKSSSEVAVTKLPGVTDGSLVVPAVQLVRAEPSIQTPPGVVSPSAGGSEQNSILPVVSMSAVRENSAAPLPMVLSAGQAAEPTALRGFEPVPDVDVRSIIPTILLESPVDGGSVVPAVDLRQATTRPAQAATEAIQAAGEQQGSSTMATLFLSKVPSSSGFTDTGVIVEAPVAPKAPELAPTEDKPVTPPSAATPESGLGTVISEQAYRDGFVQWAKGMLALNIKEVGVNAGPPSKLFMDGRSGKDFPWCVAAATGGDMALGLPFNTKFKGVEPNGRMWYTPSLVEALQKEPGSAVYPAKEFLTGDHLQGKIGPGDYVMYYYPKKNESADANHHTARILEVTKDGYWTADGNWGNKYTKRFHPWGTDDDLKYVGTRFASVGERVTHAPGAPEPALAGARKEEKPVTPDPDAGMSVRIPVLNVGGGLAGFVTGEPTEAPTTPAPVTPAPQDKKPDIPVVILTSPTTPPGSSDATPPSGADAPSQGTPKVVVLPLSGGGAGFGSGGEQTEEPPADTTPPPVVTTPEPPQSSTPTPTPAPTQAEKQPTNRDVVEEAMLHSIIEQESGGNPRAINPSTASGLFQIIDTTWEGRGGYKTARDAPPAFQYKIAEEDLEKHFKKFQKDYPEISEDELLFNVAAAWYAGPNWKKNGINIYKKQGKYPSIAEYAKEVVYRANGYLEDPSSMPKYGGLSPADNDLRIP